MTAQLGLTSRAAEAGRKRFGPNILPAYKFSGLRILFRQFNTPLTCLLFLATIISFFLASAVDALTIAAILIINGLLGFIQEYRSEHLTQKLYGLIKKTARVYRDGRSVRIHEEDIVPDDIIIISAGDVVPADGQITRTESALLDESLISGESQPVNKDVEDKIFAGTVIIRGYCEARVTGTGTRTRLGQIAALATFTRKSSKYEERISSLSSSLVKVALLGVAAIFLVNLTFKGFSSQTVISLLLFSLALAVSVVPEALPIVATLTLSSGALKLAKDHVIVKRLSSVEDLGSIEVLCTDKTGTLTQNSLSVSEIKSDFPSRLFSFLRPCLEKGSPLDDAILAKVPRIKMETYRLSATFPFDPHLRRRWAILEKGRRRFLVVLGSAEEIAGLSTRGHDKTLAEIIENGETEGYRYLAVGVKEIDRKFTFDKAFRDSGLEFLGFLTILDPIRETAVESINLAKKLAVQVKIITGDSLRVAEFVARQAGLIESNARCYDEAMLNKLNSSAFEKACLSGLVFARISPELKFKIIQTLQKHYVVGYQGDGINDAPALKAANVGIAVAHAADVARESADIVLTHSDLKVVVEGIQSGRKIFANIDKYVKDTMVSNWGNFFALAVISLFVSFLPLLPVQVLLVSLLSDIPLLLIATDNVSHAELRHPSKYIIGSLIRLPIFLGLITAILNLLFFWFFRNLPLAYFRTLWFLFIIVLDLVVIYPIRVRDWVLKSPGPSAVLILATLIGVIVSFSLPFSPLARWFYFVPVSLTAVALITLVAPLYLFILDFAKVFYYRWSTD